MYRKSDDGEDGGMAGLLGTGTGVCGLLMSPAGNFITDRDSLGWLCWPMPVFPEPRRLRQEDHKVEPCLDCIVRP